MLSMDGKLGSDDLLTISNVINQLDSLDSSLRNLTNIAELFGPIREGNLASKLRLWYGQGPNAWLFDNAKNDLDLTESCGIDLTELLDDTGMCRRRQSISNALSLLLSLDGSPVQLDFEEAWSYFRNDYWNANLEEVLRLIRKQEGWVVFSTQDVEDAEDDDDTTSVIAASTVTSVLFPNPKAVASQYSKRFNVRGEQFDWVRRTAQRLSTILNFAKSAISGR